MAGDDAVLIGRVQGGDQRAFEDLVTKYEQRLRRYLRTFVRDEEKAKELAQDTFVKVYRNAHRYEPKASFATWLFRIGHNTAISFLRKRRLPLVYGLGTENPESDLPASDVPSPAALQHDLAEAGEIASILRSELDRLPEKLREAFVLFDVEEMSIREIAEVTSSPEGTVKARIFRARRALRARLEGYVKRSERPTLATPSPLTRAKATGS